MRKFWRGLHWKLTLSYTGVTVAALLVVQILSTILIWAIVTNSNIYPRALIELARKELVPQIAVYIEGPEPDIKGLSGWLQAAETSAGLAFQSLNFPVAQVSLSDFDENTNLLVLDKDLNFLAGIPASINGNYSEILAQSDKILGAALEGKVEPTDLSEIIPKQSLTVAVPVKNETEDLLGFVVLRTVYPPRGIIVGMLSYIGGSLIFFTLAAGAVGTVFGFVTAHGLTRRLRGITRVTNQWSQGDFSTFIQQRSEDELGKLTLSLNQMAEQLQNLLHTRQELAAMEERNRLARDLHDGVKQQVFASSMQLGAARALIEKDAKAAKKHLIQAEQLTHQAQMELAEIIRELRPATLGISGLIPAIEEQLNAWSRLNNVSVGIQVKASRRLSSEIEQCLFRVTQEALSNIARHSQATKVDFGLIYDDYNVTMTISDNGKGFDMDAVEDKGVGLRSMHERVQTLGGEFKIESHKGCGTRLVVRCPINKGVS